jgi:hypothetical protein
MLYTILPGDQGAVLEIDAQEGALSVTNPPAGDANLPEVDLVTLASDGSTQIERVRGSTLLPAGQYVLDDDQLNRLFDETRRTTEYWKSVENSALPLNQQRQEMTINYELREVAPGWPVLADGTVNPTRVVIKQARTSEPSTVRIPASVKQMPIPKDILARARRVEQRVCTATDFTVIANDSYSDPLKPPDMGYADAPFTSFVLVQLAGGVHRSVIHTGYSFDHPGMDTGGTYALDVEVNPDDVVPTGLSRVVFSDGQLTVNDQTEPATCVSTVLFASPEEFLQSVLDATGGEGG